MNIRKIYIASSWRNEFQQHVVADLKTAGHQVYDFRNPSYSDHGFSWSEIDPDWDNWTTEEYLEALEHPAALRGFKADVEAMKWADTFIGVMPFGRSASMEMGWAAGRGLSVKTILFFPDNVTAEPELMVKMFDKICVGGMPPVHEALKELRPGDWNYDAIDANGGTPL